MSNLNKQQQNQQQSQPHATQFIIQNGNIYQLTTNIKNNTNININNTVINNNMFVSNNNNNTVNKTATQSNINIAPSIGPSKTIIPTQLLVDSTKQQPQQQKLQQAILPNTKKIIYKADYQQCQQAIQQQYQQKQAIVLQKNQQQSTLISTPPVLMLPMNKNLNEQLLNQQPQKKQKICYIPVNQANKVQFSNAPPQIQPQITQTVKSVSKLPHILNKPSNITQIKSEPFQNPRVIQSPSVAVQQGPLNYQISKSINEYLVPDSCIIKKVFKNLQNSQHQGQIVNQNDVLSYKKL